MGKQPTLKADIVIDIETVIHPVTSEDIDQYLKYATPPKTYKKADVIAAWWNKTREEAVDKIARDRIDALDKKRIVSVAVGVLGESSVLNVESWQSDDIKVIVDGLVDYINQYQLYRYVGWNIHKFDMPEIIKSYQLAGKFPHRPATSRTVDLYQFPFNGYSLKEAARGFGFSDASDLTKGSDVAKMHQEGRWEDIKHYNELDVVKTGKLMLAARQVYEI